MTSTPLTPQDVMRKLNTLSNEVEQKSTWLHEVEMALDSSEEEYTKFVDNYELGLLRKSETTQYKLPSEALRLKLAHEAMSPELLGRRMGLRKKRDRLERRLRDLRLQIDAQRSLLSALKEL